MEETQVSPAPETQNQAPEQAETPEVAAPEASTEQQTDKPPEQEKDPADKAVKGLLRRVDRLTAARYQEQARAEQAAREAEQLRQRLAQYEQPQQEALTPESVMPIAQQLAQQLREQEKVRETVSTVLQRGKAIEGFNEACNTVNEVLPFYERNGAPTAFLKAVFEGDAPEKVLHHLGANPDVLEELSGLSPTQVARRLDRIERDLSQPREPKQSLAPKPIAPVRNAVREDGGLSDNLPTAEWIKRFNKLRRGA